MQYDMMMPLTTLLQIIKLHKNHFSVIIVTTFQHVVVACIENLLHYSLEESVSTLQKIPLVIYSWSNIIAGIEVDEGMFSLFNIIL